LGPSYLLHNVCEPSYRICQRFASNTFRRSHGLEGIKIPLLRLLLLF